MKLREFLRYEVQHRLRSPATWISALVFLILGFLLVLVDADGISATHVNSAPRLALLGTMAGMVGMLVTAAFLGDAGLRDYEAAMDPLLFTSPIRKADYLGGRFLGALAVNAILLMAVPAAQAIATLALRSTAPVFGPFVGMAFVQEYLLFLLPNLVATAAILFAVAVLTRQIVPVYLAAIAVFVGYVIVMNLAAGDSTLTTLLDPFGLRVLNQVTERWTAVERNTRLLGSAVPLLVNRAVWLAVAAGVLVLLHRTFHFAHHVAGASERRVMRSAATKDPAVILRSAATKDPSAAEDESLLLGVEGSFAALRMTPAFGVRASLRQMLAVARRSIEEIATSPVFLLLFLGKVGLTVIMGWDAGETVFDTSTTPVTILIIERLADTPLVPITFLLVSIFAGEVIWNSRDHDMAELADATPVSEAASLTGGFIALVALLAILQLPVLVGGLIAQVSQGYTNFEVGLYIRILFGLQLADLVILAALAALVHVVVNQKYLAHLIFIVLLIARVIVREAEWVEHHLLLYGTDPGWKYSGMSGFGPYLRPAVWFKLYWGAWAAMLLVVTVLLLVRGRETGLRKRLSQARARFAGPVLRAAATAAVLIVTLGGFVFYNTNVLNTYRTAKERGGPEAGYEQRYRRYLDIPQPTIVAADLRVEIYPERSAADLRGSFRLVNRTGATLDSIHVVVDRSLQVRSLSLGSAAREVVTDSAAGYHIFALARPLAPNDSATLSFDLAIEHRGFSHGAPPIAIVDNGSWIGRRYLPLIGYQPELELTDRSARLRFGLPPRNGSRPASDPGPDRNHQSVRGDADLVRVHAIVGTSADQIGVTPGIPRRSWMDNGRRYYEYDMNPPNSVAGGFFSARYTLLQDRWHDVALRVLHDPRDGENAGRMMHGMKAALEYYTTAFGPYPDSLLEVIEIPRYNSVFGVALPTSMAFSEDAFHSNVREGQIDQPFYGTAHETAHHWWGGMVQPAPVKGHSLLSESLANYSAMMVMEKTFGPDVALRVYHFQMDRYFRGRGEFSREASLVDVEDQSYLSYRKGAVALYTLRDQLGESAINTALRRYVEKFHHDGPPYATAVDMLDELRAVTPDSMKSLITDLFETITLWEVKADSATVERMADGKYQVSLYVDAKKMRSDSLGRQSEIPMNDLIEIGVFGESKDGALGEPIYLERRRIHSGKQAIRVVVSREPKRAGIDPYDKTIDRERGGNIRDLIPATPGGP